MSEHPLYQIVNLVHHYNGQVVLEVESLNIDAGAIIGLVGPNGSGKTTLLQLLGFIQRPTDGKIFFKGAAAEPFSPEVRFSVALMPQDPYLMKRSVARNIAYGLILRGQKENLEKKIYEALDWVGLPGEVFAHRQWNELSGGEAQRVALAARLALIPQVLILDEPTANVDVYSSQLIKEATLKVREKYGTTLILASHDRDWLDETCDEIICLFKGRITGHHRDNVVFGPWFKDDSGHCIKNLSDGQMLILTAADALPSAACIDPDDIQVASTVAPKLALSSRWMVGTIYRLAMAGSQGQMMLSLRVGGLSLSAGITADQVSDQKLYPGRTVRVQVPETAVRWIAL